MSNLAFIAVVLRLLGIWILLTRSLGFLQGVAHVIDSGMDVANLAIFLGPIGGSIIIGVAMLVWPLALARLLTPRSVRGEDPTGWSPEQIQSAAFGGIGLFLIATMLISQTTWSIVFTVLSDQDSSRVVLNRGAVIGIVAGTAMGVWLLFGAKGLVGLLRTARQAGKSEVRETSEN